MTSIQKQGSICGDHAFWCSPQIPMLLLLRLGLPISSTRVSVQTCIHVWVCLIITNKLKKVIVFPLYSLALIEGICAPRNVGREACVVLCLDMRSYWLWPLIVSEFLQCSLRDVRDWDWQSWSPQTRFERVLLPSHSVQHLLDYKRSHAPINALDVIHTC